MFVIVDVYSSVCVLLGFPSVAYPMNEPLIEFSVGVYRRHDTMATTGELLLSPKPYETKHRSMKVIDESVCVCVLLLRVG